MSPTRREWYRGGHPNTKRLSGRPPRQWGVYWSYRGGDPDKHGGGIGVNTPIGEGGVGLSGWPYRQGVYIGVIGGGPPMGEGGLWGCRGGHPDRVVYIGVIGVVTPTG